MIGTPPVTSRCCTVHNASVHLMFDVVIMYYIFSGCVEYFYMFLMLRNALFEMKLQSVMILVLWPIISILKFWFEFSVVLFIYICLINNSYYHQLNGDYMIKRLGLLFLSLSVCGGCVGG
jgi:hypothetical protein